MRTVHKFPFSPDPAQASDGLTVDVGPPSIVRHVGVDPAGDGFVPCLWIEHDVDAAHFAERTFRFVGTGHQVPAGAEFVGSAVTPRGLVWHVYEMRRSVGL